MANSSLAKPLPLSLSTTSRPPTPAIIPFSTATPAGKGPSPPASLVVIDPPLISGQPASQAVGAGASVSFNVTATGSALAYQWKFNGTDISGATDPGYT